MAWVDTVLQGLLLGGLYALFATGLSLIFGVMRIVNLAHGDFSILAAFLGVVLVDALALNPLLSLVVVVPVMAIAGYLVFASVTFGDPLAFHHEQASMRGPLTAPWEPFLNLLRIGPRLHSYDNSLVDAALALAAIGSLPAIYRRLGIGFAAFAGVAGLLGTVIGTLMIGRAAERPLTPYEATIERIITLPLFTGVPRARVDAAAHVDGRHPRDDRLVSRQSRLVGADQALRRLPGVLRAAVRRASRLASSSPAPARFSARQRRRMAKLWTKSPSAPTGWRRPSTAATIRRWPTAPIAATGSTSPSCRAGPT